MQHPTPIPGLLPAARLHRVTPRVWRAGAVDLAVRIGTGKAAYAYGVHPSALGYWRRALGLPPYREMRAAA